MFLVLEPVLLRSVGHAPVLGLEGEPSFGLLLTQEFRIVREHSRQVGPLISPADLAGTPSFHPSFVDTVNLTEFALRRHPLGAVPGVALLFRLPSPTQCVISLPPGPARETEPYLGVHVMERVHLEGNNLVGEDFGRVSYPGAVPVGMATVKRIPGIVEPLSHELLRFTVRFLK